jgi:hypothetical protein
VIVPWELLRAIALAVAIVWGVGTLVILAARPWRHFERNDRWVAWALILGWPLIFGAMAVELALEWRLDRKEAGTARVR